MIGASSHFANATMRLLLLLLLCGVAAAKSVPPSMRVGDLSDKREGKCVSGDCDDGKGKWVYAEHRVGKEDSNHIGGVGGEDSYEGDWVNGKRHGQGIFMHGAEHYVGGWKDDKKHGKGGEFGSEAFYEGEFANGVKHGEGKERKGGLLFTGTWNEGVFDKETGTIVPDKEEL